jgi:hypothetical protein
MERKKRRDRAFAHLLSPGFKAHVLEKPDDVSGMWRSALSSTGAPVLIEAVTDAQVPILPPTVTEEQVKSLALAVKGTE